MKTFKDLEFKDHPMVKGAKEAIKKGVDMTEEAKAKQAKIKFENGVVLSVIFGSIFYSNGVDTYECMTLGSDEPIGYLTEDEVTKYMVELQK